MLRVLTLNVWNVDGPWADRRVEIVRWIDRLRPDVVCLQEVVDGEGGNQASWLAGAAEVSYRVAYSGVDVGRGGLFGNAVLSRWDVDEEHTMLLPGGRTEGDIQRLAFHVRTGGLDVFCVHLCWPPEAADVRREQVLALVGFVNERADPAAAVPPIVAGDFNSPPDSDEIRFLTGRSKIGETSTYFQDAWSVAGGGAPGLTWDNRNPFAAPAGQPARRIDYIFSGRSRTGGAGKVASAQLVCDEAITGTFASDHFGVMAELWKSSSEEFGARDWPTELK